MLLATGSGLSVCTVHQPQLVVSALRFIETHATQQPASPSVGRPTVAAVSRQPQQAANPEQADSKQDADSVLGLLTSLLHQQTQQHSSSSSQAQHDQQQQQRASQQVAMQAAMAPLSQQWPHASSQVSSSSACGPDLSAASSGVRMESQLVFDSCWRRFRERRGMVSCWPS